MCKIKYSKNALKFLAKQNKSDVNRIRVAIEKLAQTSEGDVKPLQGVMNGERRLRVGRYRVIYKYGEEEQVTILLVEEIGCRGDVYK